MTKYTLYPPQLKQIILQRYKDSQYQISFRELAKLYNIKGGHKVIRLWYKQWNGKIESLYNKYKSGRPPILNNKQTYNYITKFIRNHNRKAKKVHYHNLYVHIKNNLQVHIAERTIRKYGKDLGIKYKTAKPKTELECKFILLYLYHNIICY
jgi:transposase